MACDHHHHTPINLDTPLGKKHARALNAVTALNGVMVVIEAGSSIGAKSTALFTDMLDMLSDTVSSALGSYGLKKSERWQAGAALVKAGCMLALGVGAFSWAAFRIFNPLLPVAAVMTGVGALALTANAACVGLLYPYRNDSLNIKSTYACVKNDMISNVALIGAGLASGFFASFWPDVIVAMGVSGMFIHSSVSIARESFAALREQSHDHHDDEDHHHAPHATCDMKGPTLGQRFKNKLGAFFNKQAAVSTEKVPAPSCHAHHHPEAPKGP